MPVPLSYKVRKYRYQLIFIFVFVTLIYHFHHSSSTSSELKAPVSISSNNSPSQDYDPDKPAGPANHQPVPPSKENVKVDDSKPAGDADKSVDQEVDIDKVPKTNKKPFDPPPFKNDKPGFKEDDVPKDYSMKDDKMAVAPKPPGAGSPPKQPVAKGDPPPKLGLGTKEGPTKEAKEALPPLPDSDDSSNNARPLKGSDLANKYKAPTKEDFLTLDIVTSSSPNTRFKTSPESVNELLPSVKTLPRKDRHPVDKLIALPKADLYKKIPKIQAEKFYKPTSAEEKIRLQRLATVKEAFLVSWKQYKEYAWGKDEILPVSQEGFDPFAGWSATLVDALDTLLIMGLKDEFAEAIEVVKTIDFSTTFRKDIPIFETVIRYLGGLLSAYDLSSPKESILLTKAIELGNNLMGAFDTPNRMPKISFLWTDAAQKYSYRASAASPFAEVGSLSVEFTRLAQLTGDNTYFDAIDRITTAIYEMAPKNDIPYLFDQKVDASGCKISPLPEDMKAENTAAAKQHPLTESQKAYESAFVQAKKQGAPKDPLNSFVDLDSMRDDEDEEYGNAASPSFTEENEAREFVKRAVTDFDVKERKVKDAKASSKNKEIEAEEDEDEGESEVAKPSKSTLTYEDDDIPVAKPVKPVAASTLVDGEDLPTVGVKSATSAKSSKSATDEDAVDIRPIKAAVETDSLVIEEDDELKPKASAESSSSPSASSLKKTDPKSSKKPVVDDEENISVKKAIKEDDDFENIPVKKPATKDAKLEDVPVKKASSKTDNHEVDNIPAKKTVKPTKDLDPETSAKKSTAKTSTNKEEAKTPTNYKKIINVFGNGRSAIMACSEQAALSPMHGKDTENFIPQANILQTLIRLQSIQWAALLIARMSTFQRNT